MHLDPHLATLTQGLRALNTPDWYTSRTQQRLVILAVLDVQTPTEQDRITKGLAVTGPTRLQRFTSTITDIPETPDWCLALLERMYTHARYQSPTLPFNAMVSALRSKILSHPHTPEQTLRLALKPLLDEAEHSDNTIAVSVYPFIFEGSRILAHPACPIDLLEAACYSPSAHLREAALRNPKTPDDARIVAALLGTHSPND